ncbi:MAG: arsenate reductase [Bacteroidetes bacterium 4572_77]|nr:MAG: arsenate reductase [Bacteroidetes bacterium 4572_77]
MIKIYHNSRCKKSRAGLDYLSAKTDKYEIVQYLKDDLFTEVSLTKLLDLLQKKPLEMIRKQEVFFKKEIKGKEFTDKELIALMVENPKLINRPIVLNGNKAVWGDPAENIQEIL